MSKTLTKKLNMCKMLILFLFWQVRVSAMLTNAPFILNLDCDHYINNSKALREAMCFMMDPSVGKRVCYVQFPQRFNGIDRSDRYANHNTIFFDVRITPFLHHPQAPLERMSLVEKIFLINFLFE